MSSAPSYSNMPAPSAQSGKRTHRHRRSGAISGNFDVAGLGFFSPPPPISNAPRHSPHSLNPTPQISSGSPHLRLNLSHMVFNTNSDSDVLDWHYNFCNEEDFSNKPTGFEFEFPAIVPNSPASPFLSPSAAHSPLNRLSGGLPMLNSPIRLRNKRSVSSMNGTSKLFLTDETVMNKDNVPDALIDLDEILNHNNMLADRSVGDNCVEPLFGEAGLPPPHRSHTLQLHTFSPFSSPAYFKHQIREPSDAIEEEDDIEEIPLNIPPSSITLLSTSQPGTANDSATASNSVPLTASTASDLYQLSVNSSNTSLPSIEYGTQRNLSATLLEKSISNSSRDSGYSGLAFVKSNSIKRGSGAKASRYQTFYDQSLKISYALKNSSAENLITCSPGGNSIQIGGNQTLQTPNHIASNGLNNNPHHYEALGQYYSLKAPAPLPRSSGTIPIIVTSTNNDQRPREPKYGLHTSILLHNIPNRTQDLLPRNMALSAASCDSSYRLSSKLGLAVGGPSLATVDRFKVGNEQNASSAEDLNKSSFDDNLQSPPSLYSGAESTVTTPGEHATDHSSLLSPHDAIRSEMKAERSVSRSVTPVTVADIPADTETPNRRINDVKSKHAEVNSIKNLRTLQDSPPFLNDPQELKLLSSSSLETVPRMAPRTVSPSQQKVLQATRIPPYSPSELKLRIRRHSAKANPKDGRSSGTPSSSNENRKSEHKRTGSGHRLLSNWFRRCT